MAVVVVATLFPVAEHRGEVIEALEITAEKVQASDDDCLLYAMHEGPDGRIVMIEKYSSMEALAAHGKSAGAGGARRRPRRQARAEDGRAGTRAALGRVGREGRALTKFQPAQAGSRFPNSGQ